MPRVDSKHDGSYLWLSLATTLVMVVGFSSTYFGPMLRGEYPAVSPTVHLHGWTFFLWYLLLPLQAGLVAARKVRLHRTLGYASLALALAMSATGLVVISVQMRLAAQPDGSPFWQAFGPGVFITLVLFLVFYALALHYRRARERHKRFILLASCGALGAAAFRVMSLLVGMTPLAVYSGIVLPNLIVATAMLLEWRHGERVHPIYRWGLPLSVLVEAAVLATTPTVAGQAISAMLARVGAMVAPLY